MAKEHLRVYQQIEQVEICGITSRTIEKARTLSNEFGGFPVFSSIQELYKTTQADLVIVAVNAQSIKTIGIECFSFPWVVFLEKPIGIDYQEGLDILRSAQQHKSRVAVGLNRRYYSNLMTQKNQISKEHNDGLIIHIYDQQDERKALKLGHPEKVVKNWMYANSIHLIDLFRFFGMGSIQYTQPVVFKKNHIGEKGFIISKIVFSNGNIGIYEGVWNMPGLWAVVVNSENHRWESRPLEKTVVRILGDNKDIPIDNHPWDSDFKPGLRFQAQEVVKYVRNEPSNPTLLEDGLETMKLVNSIYTNDVVEFINSDIKPSY